MTLITNSEELQALSLSLEKEKFLAVDCEFIRRTTYYPRLCLLQIATSDHAYAIDAIACPDLSPLYKVLTNKAIVKVLHSGRQDLEILFRLLGALPAPIFDTQVAAMVLGYGDSVGYEKLVQSILNRKLDKTHQFSEWAQRPLSQAQLEYALNDVIYLRALYEHLLDQLQSSNRLHWIEEELAALVNPAMYEVNFESIWKKVPQHHLKAKEILLLQRLACFREEAAIQLDLPRSHVISDKLLILLVKHFPSSLEELKQKLSRTPLSVHEELLQQCFTLSRKDISSSSTTTPLKIPVYNEPLLAMLKLLLQHIAEQEKVSPSLLATTEHLKRFAEIPSSHPVPFLKGWRYDIFGCYAQQLLEGKLAFALENKRLKFLPLV